jgi:hypothetical protein
MTRATSVTAGGYDAEPCIGQGIRKRVRIVDDSYISNSGRSASPKQAALLATLFNMTEPCTPGKVPAMILSLSPSLNSDARCETPCRFDIGSVDQDLREWCDASGGERVLL